MTKTLTVPAVQYTETECFIRIPALESKGEKWAIAQLPNLQFLRVYRTGETVDYSIFDTLDAALEDCGVDMGPQVEEDDARFVDRAYGPMD